MSGAAQSEGNSRDPVLFSAVETRPIDYLWRDRLPQGMIAVVAGRRDQGKGLFAAHVAADISKAGGNVLYSAFEDDAARMTKPRLVAAGADLDRVIGWRFQVPRQMAELEARIVNGDIRLCILDPFASHLSGGIRRESDGVRIVTDELSEIGERTGCTFLIIEHMLKRVSRYTDPGDAVAGGSSGLPSAARAMFIYGQDPSDPDRRVMAPAKFNIGQWPKALAFETDVKEVPGAGEVPYLVAREESDLAARVLLDSSQNKRAAHRPPDKRTAAAEWLARRLHSEKGPVQAGKVAEDAIQQGLTRKTLRNAADDMGIVKNPPGGGRSCTWDLPKPVRDAMDKAAQAQKGGK
jgi:hypothetical protein